MLIDNNLGARLEPWKIEQTINSYSFVDTSTSFFVKSNLDAFALIQTIGSVCRQQGQKLVEELILLAHERLLQGQSATDVFSRLFAKQNKEVPA